MHATRSTNSFPSARLGVLALCASLLLTGCETTPTASGVEIIYVPTEVLTKIPDERTEPLDFPSWPLPPYMIRNGDLEERIRLLEETVAEANADRQWIRDRERAQ